MSLFSTRISSLINIFKKSYWSSKAIPSNSPKSNQIKRVLLIQIDGLSRHQFENAIRCGRLPFLKKLIIKNSHNLKSFYSGLPSSTPAVQGELFYGVKCAVPGFGFFDRKSGKLFSMLTTRAAEEIEKKLEATTNSQLLSGGSAYSDIYTGGAFKASYCASSKGFGTSLQNIRPLNLIITFICYGWVFFLRSIMLVVIELFLSAYDLVLSFVMKENIRKELRFIPSRLAVCVVLRELITAGVITDISRDVPIIHCNYLGYDEQSHRRGPSSQFAHWTLKGIDHCIERIYLKAAIKNYEVCIYSDHGQEWAVSYVEKHKQSLYSSVLGIINEHENAKREHQKKTTLKDRETIINDGGMSNHAVPGKVFSRPQKNGIFVVAVGPIGHIYITKKKYSINDKQKIAASLIENQSIPLVLFNDSHNKVHAITKTGTYILPEQTIDIIGDHPFLESIKEDLVTLVNHPDSGDLIISGWKRYGYPLSFPIENGAHAGPGTEETHGFILLPSAFYTHNSHSYLRPLDLRNAVLHFKNSV